MTGPVEKRPGRFREAPVESSVLARATDAPLGRPTFASTGTRPPATVRRMVAYIDAHLDQPLSVVDIARAACVTPRAVQLAFRRHLDTTPMTYVRRARLEQAHRQLRDSTLNDGVTVTAVATRWGFTPSRFAQHYRATYGQRPSRTLRT
jgi:transcriptional regulator GlxA family with amidase domain